MSTLPVARSWKQRFCEVSSGGLKIWFSDHCTWKVRDGLSWLRRNPFEDSNMESQALADGVSRCQPQATITLMTKRWSTWTSGKSCQNLLAQHKISLHPLPRKNLNVISVIELQQFYRECKFIPYHITIQLRQLARTLASLGGLRKVWLRWKGVVAGMAVYCRRQNPHRSTRSQSQLA